MPRYLYEALTLLSSIAGKICFFYQNVSKFASFLKTNRQCLEYQDVSEAKQACEYSQTLSSSYSIKSLSRILVMRI